MHFARVKKLVIWYVKLAALLCLVFVGLCCGARAGELGVDKFDLLLQYLPPSVPIPDVEGYRQVRRAMAKKAIADAHDADITFLRVSVTGYWPVNFEDKTNDLALWQGDPSAFWAATDEMLDDLDRASIRLVPTFVWNNTQFPVLGGDTIATFIRDSQSRSRHILARFVADFITRYKDRKTILFYELTNELNLLADLDLRRECKLGTNPCVLDDFTTTDMVAFSGDLVRLIKSLDPSWQVSSGYSIPRPAAWHLMRQPEFSSRGG
jgi:endo-1,4-beta-mannosidase